MTRNYGKSLKGKRSYYTTNEYPFIKYNFICAIKNNKIIGYTLYENLKGGIKTDEFVDFIDKYIKNKYKNYYILLDNASFHKSKIIKEKIIEIKNNIIYSIPYNPDTNPIENFFSQLKNYVRNENPKNFNDLFLSIKNTFESKIKIEHLNNYFDYLLVQANNYLNKHCPNFH
jgi:transposase